MMSSGSQTSQQYVNSKVLVVGFALVLTGGLISTFGLGITGATMYRGIRRWVVAQQEPPTQVMKRKISQAKSAATAATSAGSSAWQNGMATTRQ